ncbi:MAG: hypothetical protein JWN26_735 [Candidatus Saccharibacteria bacterium]|nr:hypothetical protein [Candidatus Saccharibacteria bacterium]
MPVKSKTKRNITNFFGGVGYFFCSLQWLLTIIIYSSFIKTTLTSFTPVDMKPAKPIPVVIDLATNTPLMIIGVIFTLAVVALAIYVFVKIPSTVAKTSKTIVHEVTEASVPVVMRIQHLPETKQNRKKIVFKMTIAIKILIIIAPLVISFCSQFTVNQTLDFSVSIYLSILLAILTSLFFILQYVMARLFSVSKEELW